ncbi:MAG: nucleotide exchange factor GrpE, partial [Prevotellaceae bacterium]|nr:nucleotide exchange factor GrpE [Prevotellaceae bacterium]
MAKDIKKEELEAEVKAEAEEEKKEPTIEERLAEAEARIAELEKDRLYKQAEFDNYRRNAIKEKADLILNGGRKVLETMLPVVDDFELAVQHIEAENDIKAVKEGVELILKKLLQTLKSHGVEQMDTKDKDFNTDYHEAIAQIPAPKDE